MKSSNKPIVVFGGTGHYGQKVVKKLLDKGQPVRVLSRNARKAKALLGQEVECIEGDVCDPGSVQNILQGAGGIVVSLSAMSPKRLRRERAIEYDAVLHIMEEAKRQQVDRLVYLSVYDIRPELLKKLKMEAFAATKLEVEQKITASQLNWTILGCAPSFDLFFTFLRGKRMMVPGGGYRRLPSIYPEDVGEIAARAVLRDDLSGRRFHMTGPEAFSFPEFAERVTKITGKPVKHGAIPLGIINGVSRLVQPFNPFLRFIYYGVKLFNNFPEDLAEAVPEDHQLLKETFGYAPVSIEEVIRMKLI